MKFKPERNDERFVPISFFSKEDNNSYGHFGSVIREVPGGGNKKRLMKIRPPFFYLYGLLSNFARTLSGTGTRKILDNRRWKDREMEQLQNIHPDLSIESTPFENSIMMDKIEGEVAFDILNSEEVDDEEKLGIVVDLVESLEELHDKGLYHGEPNTQNCVLTEEGDIYWIDFEIEYDEQLSLVERKARDLEQLTLSILGAFREEGEIGVSDHELVDIMLQTYEDEEVVDRYLQDQGLPFIGPYRLYQLTFISIPRFYQVQINLMRYFYERSRRS